MDECNVIGPGTKLYVLGHWTGHCSHDRGQVITVTGRGFVENELYPGHYSGSYRWEENGEEIIGVTTGLRVSLTPPDEED
jgi:hypothetical protein